MPNDLMTIFEAMGQIKGPLTFFVFLAILLAWVIRYEKIAEALANRLGLDRRSYLRLMIFISVVLFAIVVFVLALSIQATGTELYVLIGSALILTLLLVGFALWVMKDNVKGRSSEIVLTGNVYWDDKDSGLEGIPNAELRVTGLQGDWKTSGEGYFEIPIRSSIYTSKQHEITVIVSNPPGVKRVTIPTRKTKGIKIKVSRPPQYIPSTSDRNGAKIQEKPSTGKFIKEAGSAPKPSTPGDIDRKTQRLLSSDFSSKLFNILLTINSLKDRNNRDMLLRNLPEGPVLAMPRSDSPMADLNIIVSTAKSWERLEHSGEWALTVIAKNALRLTKGTQPGHELEALLAQIEA